MESQISHKEQTNKQKVEEAHIGLESRQQHRLHIVSILALGVTDGTRQSLSCTHQLVHFKLVADAATEFPVEWCFLQYF